jgi:HEAT repeat protein
MKKKLIILTVSLCALILILGNYAKAQSTEEKPLTEEQIEAFRSAKTARISVKQSYRYARGVILPYEDIAGTIFKDYAKLTLVGSDATDYDLDIKITAGGSAISSNYGSIYGTLYAGASVYGTISLEIPGIPAYEKKFSGSINPPKKLKISFAKEQPDPKGLVLNVPFRSRSQAPFKPALESGTYVSRMIEMIGEIWDPNCVQAALQDESWIVRKSAVEALIEIKDPRVLRAETNEVLALMDKISDIKAKAAEKPAEVKDPGVEELLTSALKDEEPRVRMKVAEVLGKIRDQRSVELLITALKDEEPDVRMKAVEVLGDTKDPSAVEPLIAALQDVEPEVRVKVTGVLGSIKDPRAVEPLIACLKDEYWSVRESAINALSWIKDPRAVDPLIATLKYEETELPGEVKDPRSPLELRTLEKRKSNLRIKAAYALASFKDPRAVEALIAASKDDSLEVRIDLVKALGRIEDPSVVEPLIAALIDESWPVREAAAMGLGRIKDPRAVEPLIFRLADKNRNVQERAAEALGEIKDLRAIEPLIAVLQNKGGFVANRASKALQKITGTGRPFGTDHKKWQKWWKQNKMHYIKDK